MRAIGAQHRALIDAPNVCRAGARAAAGAGAGALAGAGAACVTRISGAHVPVTKKAEINDTLGIDELLRRSPAD